MSQHHVPVIGLQRDMLVRMMMSLRDPGGWVALATKEVGCDLFEEPMFVEFEKRLKDLLDAESGTECFMILVEGSDDQEEIRL